MELTHFGHSCLLASFPGTTILFVEHNMRAVLELCDRLVVLNYGAVIASGAPREVMRNPEVVSAYLGGTHA